MKALNKSQVTALFEREAILMGTDDFSAGKRATCCCGLPDSFECDHFDFLLSS